MRVEGRVQHAACTEEQGPWRRSITCCITSVHLDASSALATSAFNAFAPTRAGSLEPWGKNDLQDSSHTCTGMYSLSRIFFIIFYSLNQLNTETK